MKIRNLMGERFKERPSDCVTDSHALMVRGGYIKIWINGVFQNECHGFADSGRVALQSEGGPLRIRKVTLTPAN